MASKNVTGTSVTGQPTVSVQQPAVSGQPAISDKPPAVSDKPTAEQPVTEELTNQPEDDTLINEQKRIELDKLKSLEDNIILYIKKSGQHNKSIFLSMLINYVISYSGYPESLEELNKNNGIGFEKHIKMYLIQLLNHYQNPKSSLKNEDISFSQIKLMLLSFFHKKISIIPDVAEPQIQHINTGSFRLISLSKQKENAIKAAIKKAEAKQQKELSTTPGTTNPGTTNPGTTTGTTNPVTTNQGITTPGIIPKLPSKPTPEELKIEFEKQKRGGFKDFSELSQSLSNIFEERTNT
jgi:hypothetical protein